MSNPIRLITIELDGKKIAFASNAEFLVQIGKGKGSYKTKYRFTGDFFNAAFLHYKGLNVANGYKKRLISYNLNKPVLVRQLTTEY